MKTETFGETTGEKEKTDNLIATSLQPDQENIIEHLRFGPQYRWAISRRIYVLCSDSRPHEIKRQLDVMLSQGLIDRLEDGAYKLSIETNGDAANWLQR